MATRKERMSKLEMPPAPAAEDSELMLDDEMMAEEDGMDTEEEMDMSPLADFSDEELMAEIEARGLSMEAEDEEMMEDEDAELAAMEL